MQDLRGKAECVFKEIYTSINKISEATLRIAYDDSSLSELLIANIVGKPTHGHCISRSGRAIRETHMNQASSRSHSIFQIVVEQKRRSAEDGERILRSKFNLVDLAG